VAYVHGANALVISPALNGAFITLGNLVLQDNLKLGYVPTFAKDSTFNNTDGGPYWIYGS
jgi:hypothetical protein